MATVEEIAQLRLAVAEPDETTYTDQMLSALLDGLSGEALPMSAAAAFVWTQKAAGYADLVDISEGGSSRKNGELHKNALAMAKLFRDQADSATDLGRRTTIARLAR